MASAVLENDPVLTGDGLAEKIQWLMDRTEIEDLLARYSRGIDRGDIEVLKSVYHPDALDEHGIFSGTGHEFAEWVVPHLRSTYVTIHHNFTTTSIDIRGETAQAETYFLCVNRHKDNSLEFCGGRCADRFEKREGRWGIAYRQVIMDWTEYAEAATASPMQPSFVRGGYTEADPSYRDVPGLRTGGFFPGRRGG